MKARLGWTALCAVLSCTGTGAGPQSSDPDPPPRPPAQLGERLRVAVVSDLNGSYGSTAYDAPVHGAVARLRALRPDLVLSTGDMVAGQRPGLNYRAMWDAFHAAVTDPLAEAGIPFAPTPGNHDASGYPSFARERAAYVASWDGERRPELDFIDGSRFPMRYSFTRGPALFVSLDATTLGPLDGEQKRWLARQLRAGADRPVKIVYAHIPLYPFTQGREREAMHDPDFEQLLLRHGVTLFLSGHHHAYYPGRRGPLRLVSMPCLGDGPRRLIGHHAISQKSFVLLDLDATGVRTVEAYAGDAFDALIERTTLPEQVGWGEARILRDDLSPPVQVGLR